MICITGVAGFVGSNIAQRLINEGLLVFGIDDLSFGNMKNVPENKNFRFEKMGFNELPEQTLRNADILIHCATSNIIYSMDHPVETFKNNAGDTIKLFNRFHGKIIYTGTSSVYGNTMQLPTPEDAEILSSNAYDISKHIAELYLQKRGNFTTLRLTNVYGKNQRADNPFCGVIGKLIDCAFTGKKFTVYGEGKDTRDYTNVEDVVEAVLQAVKLPAMETEINVGTGVETSTLQLISLVREICNVQVQFFSMHGRPIDKIHRRCLDIRKAKTLLNWEPRFTLAQGLPMAIEWYATKMEPSAVRI
jgi:UDP-glucose 4-epimerase